MDNIKKWHPVLRKCKEFSEDQYEIFADALENQFQDWCGTSDVHTMWSTSVVSDNIVDFTRFALPINRRVIARLLKEGFTINVVDAKIGKEIETFPMETLTQTELEAVTKHLLGIDREAALCDIIADMMMEEITAKIPSKKIDLYVLMTTIPKHNLLECSGRHYILGKLRKSV